MAKATRSVAPTTRQRTEIPLADVEITFDRPEHFIGEKAPVPVTIRGKDLAAVLSWMAREAPGRPTEFDDAESVGYIMEGLGVICRAAAGSDHAIAEASSVFYTLGTILTDYQNRLSASEDADEVAQSAVVRITRAADAKAEVA